ncbi:MAG TPA: patatin-like phospholipase family protein [Candidatus Limnocylindrales bacterium]|nr:patatin-like phospholipase family protein [Candidatus Limnocylindrales bacterium]
MKAQEFIFCGVLVLVSGCCSTRHCENAGHAVTNYQFHASSVREIMEARSLSTETNIEMLVLSGGGSHGAWGAGVLRGWRQNPQNPRPGKFRVVTGVSTGALLATYAFLGDYGDDQLLEQAYTTVKTKDIYRKKFLLFALFSDALYSSRPLKHTIAKYISEDTLRRVAKAGREENRRVYVGTVNHDSGKLIIWDLTAIAMDTTNPKRLDLYRQVVLASASIPILVSPVNIDGNLYADGGARAQLFFEKDFFQTFRHIKEMEEAGGARHPDLTFHIIINGKMGPDPNAACVKDCLSGIAKSTLDMLLDANETGNLYQIEHVRNRIGFGKMWYAPIPKDFEVTPSDEFVPEKMKALYQAGVEFGQAGKWTNHLPDPGFD